MNGARTSLLAAIGLMACTLAVAADEIARHPADAESVAGAQSQPADATAAMHALLRDSGLTSFADLSENSYDFNAPGGVPGFGPIDGESSRERRLAHVIDE
jgi:hypothetical protein